MTNPEYAVLSALKERGEFSLHSLLEPTGLQADSIRRILSGLEEQGLVVVKREKVQNWVLTESGESIINRGYFPEEYFYSILVENESVPLREVMEKFIAKLAKEGLSLAESSKEFSAAFGKCKQKNFVQVVPPGNLVLTKLGQKGLNNIPEKAVLQAIARGEIHSDSSVIISELSARGLIAQKQSTNELVQITNKGVEFLKTAKPEKASGKTIGPLTPQLLASGEWKNATFKPYDVTAGVEPKYAGRIHPLRHTFRDVRRIMTELGFQEHESPLVESSFWNMDVMFIPQDHPARELQDTFYLPGKAVLPDADLIKRIKATHEHGGKTGSKGFGYEWDPKIAMQLLLRTHVTATTFRTLAKNLPIPSKTFSIGRVYRNEAIDATHLAEFHQVDGLIVGEGLTLRHLMGIVKEFYAKLGLTEIRFKPTYNPYTEPSMESAVYHPGLDKWVEIVNSGMFRPETLRPLGINVPVISWSFGIERLALFLHEKEMLKEISGPDVPLDFIRNYPGINHRIPGKKEGSHGQR